MQQRIDPQRRKTLATFRLGNHKLAIETLRYVSPKIPYANRICPLCGMEAETEIHFLFKCGAAPYQEKRQKFIAEVTALVKNYDALCNEDNVFYLMAQENTDVTIALAEYITQITKIREEALVP